MSEKTEIMWEFLNKNEKFISFLDEKGFDKEDFQVGDLISIKGTLPKEDSFMSLGVVLEVPNNKELIVACLYPSKEYMEAEVNRETIKLTLQKEIVYYPCGDEGYLSNDVQRFEKTKCKKDNKVLIGDAHSYLKDKRIVVKFINAIGYPPNDSIWEKEVTATVEVIKSFVG